MKMVSSNDANSGKTMCRPRLECEIKDHYLTIEEILNEDADAVNKRPSEINRDWVISLFIELLSQNKDSKSTIKNTIN